MTTMLERAARAAAYAWFLGDFEPEHAAAAAANDWTDFEEVARAVLMAVREPDEATVTNACDHGYYSAPDLEIHFGAMIDAILEGK